MLKAIYPAFVYTVWPCGATEAVISETLAEVDASESRQGTPS
jgi:hypothetical protein